MMQRNFTKREKVLICILLVLLLAACYIRLVAVPVEQEKMAAADRLADAQMMLRVEQVKSEQLRMMEEELAKVGTANLSELAPYDNVRAVAALLDQTLAVTEDFEVTFLPVEFEGTLAKRSIVLTFHCKNYDYARRIVDDLYASPYRCEVVDVSMRYAQAKDAQSVYGEDLFRKPLEGKMTVVFYESCQ